ncbi:hypothetical protein [Ekhidna sp.]|uniref:hypothetical protein n=1 Tax=Ekhidna sp. TaxID=2608089 RepID=UPI00329A7E90
MQRLVFILVFIGISSMAYSQVKVDGKATGKHANAINRAKQTKQTAKQRKEQLEKLEQQVKARELYSQKFDSLKAVQLDSIQMEEFSKEDSLEVSREILESAGFPPEYSELIRNPIVLEPVIDPADADSLALLEATKVLEAEARKFLPDDLGAQEDPLSQFTNPAGSLATLQKPSKPNPNLVKPDQARKLFEKIDPEQFQEAQADIQKLKKKYSKLPDTRYPEEGTKRNSLEDIPFKKRIYFGGNLSLQSTDPVIINTNLQLGYWINKKWLGGVGIILREQFANDSTSALTGDGYGYSFFTRYEIPKGFFAWAEVERQINKSFFSSESPVNPKWQSAYLVGVGREFKIGIVQMMSLILYDFNYQSNDLNARPLVFKLGVRFSKKPD